MSAIESWPRPHLQPGGGDAFLFYWIPGEFPRLGASPSGEKYKVARVPPGLEFFHRRRADDKGAFDEMLQGPFGKYLTEHSPGLEAAVRAAREYVVLRGAIKAPENLDYLRDTVGLITWLTDTGGVAVLDWQTLGWSTPKEWRDEFFTPGAKHVIRHATILVSREDEHTLWFHTRGMRKFGRPDVSLRHVPKSTQGPAAELCQRFIALQALGALVPEGQEIAMSGLPEGMTAHHAGSVEDPDFNNVHLELRWPMH